MKMAVSISFRSGLIRGDVYKRQMDDSVNVVLSGEYYYQPLEGEISPLEGETMDCLLYTSRCV